MAYRTGFPVPARFLLVHQDGQTAMPGAYPDVIACAPGASQWRGIPHVIELGNGFYEAEIPADLTQDPGSLIVIADAPGALQWRDLIDLEAAQKIASVEVAPAPPAMTPDAGPTEPEGPTEPQGPGVSLLTGPWRTPAAGTENEIESAGPDKFAYTPLRTNNNQQAYISGIEIEPGSTYVLSFSHSADIPTSATIHLHDHLSTGSKLGISGHRIHIEQEETPERIEFTAPAGSDNARLRFMFGSTVGNTATITGCSLEAAS